MSNGGYGAGLNWYRSALRYLDKDDEKGKVHYGRKWLTTANQLDIWIDIPSGQTSLDRPVLLILGVRSPITMVQIGEKATKLYSKDFEAKRMDTGHWPQLEAKDETNQHLDEFFLRVLTKSSL